MRGVLAALIGVGLFAAWPARATDEHGHFANIHTVAIISAIGDRIAMTNLGLMVFGNSEQFIDGGAWNLDADVTGRIVQCLPGGTEVKAVAFDKAAFYALEGKEGWLDHPAPTQDLVAKLDGREGIDAYIVVFPLLVPDPMFDSHQPLRGLGIYRRQQMGHSGMPFVHRDEPDAPAAYAFFEIDMVDARTGQVIGRARAHRQLTRFSAVENPWSSIPASAWADKAVDLTAAQKEVIRAALSDLVAKSVPWTFNMLGFSNEQPGIRGVPAN